MRRKDKEILDKSVIDSIIKRARVCRLGIMDGDRPYIVPLNFGYRRNILYFHGSTEGKKIDLIRKNPNVCFEFDLASELMESENACNWSMRYQSVIGFGRASLVEGVDEKNEALSIIMSQYSDRLFSFPENTLEATCVFKVEIEEITGKQSRF